jgi:hypothetical protein
MESKPVYIYPFSPEELSEKFLQTVDSRLVNLLKKLQVSKNDEEELLTVDETLNFLKCSKQALWNWRKNGVLPSYRMGNRVYYKKSDIFSKLIKQE